MDLSTMVKLKKDINTTDLSGEKVMIDFESGKYYMIKGVGNDIWDMIRNEITVGDIIDRLMKEYDVSREKCTKSVIDFLTKLEEMEFLG